MEFDKAAYKTAKKRIIGLIKDSHDWENTEGFIADGVICPDVYEKQPLRILCILAESYGYEEGMEDIENQMEQDIMGLRNPTVQTPRRLASVLYLLQHAIEKKSMLQLEEWLALKLLTQSEKNTSILQGALSKIAWINVKKASRGNGTELDNAEAQAHARKNRDILREQIESIAPELMIICGEAAFRALHEMSLLGPEVMLARKWQIQGAGDGSPRVIEVTHPSYYKWAGYEDLYRIAETIYTQIA